MNGQSPAGACNRDGLTAQKQSLRRMGGHGAEAIGATSSPVGQGGIGADVENLQPPLGLAGAAAHLSLAHPGSSIATTVSLFDQAVTQVLRKLPPTISSIHSRGGSISAN